MTIAIHHNPEVFDHSTSWAEEWVSYCQERRLRHEKINLLKISDRESLRRYDTILWHINNYSPEEMMFARSALQSAQAAGVKVFPDPATSWHFDDKVAQSMLLGAVGAPTPRSWLFVTEGESVDWLEKNRLYPLVAKLRTGSGSHNVTLLRNRKSALSYIRQMFRSGISPSPSLLYKASSNARTAKDLGTLIKRAQRMPEFLRTRHRSQGFPSERGYVYFQEFIPNPGYDLKVVVIGDKVSAFSRDVRSGDFRASGGGSINYDPERIPADVLASAFEASDATGSQCMGYDFVIDERTGRGVIIEASYGFSHKVLAEVGGYWDRSLTWHARPMNAPRHVLENLLASPSVNQA